MNMKKVAVIITIIFIAMSLIAQNQWRQDTIKIVNRTQQTGQEEFVGWHCLDSAEESICYAIQSNDTLVIYPNDSYPILSIDSAILRTTKFRNVPDFLSEMEIIFRGNVISSFYALETPSDMGYGLCCISPKDTLWYIYTPWANEDYNVFDLYAYELHSPIFSVGSLTVGMHISKVKKILNIHAFKQPISHIFIATPNFMDHERECVITENNDTIFLSPLSFCNGLCSEICYDIRIELNQDTISEISKGEKGHHSCSLYEEDKTGFYHRTNSFIKESIRLQHYYVDF